MEESFFLYLVPVDGYHQLYQAPMQRAVSYGFALADGLPNLNGGLPPPADGLPLATDSEDNERSSRSCKIAAFGIGCQG